MLRADEEAYTHRVDLLGEEIEAKQFISVKVIRQTPTR